MWVSQNNLKIVSICEILKSGTASSSVVAFHINAPPSLSLLITIFFCQLTVSFIHSLIQSCIYSLIHIMKIVCHIRGPPTFLSQDPFAFLKITEEPKELLLM